jgi:hypothetical protein
VQSCQAILEDFDFDSLKRDIIAHLGHPGLRHRERRSDGGAPLVDEQLADESLGRAQAPGAELLGPDGLLSQVTRAVLERALGEE